jgi:hypothetical protein
MSQRIIFTLWVSFFVLAGMMACSDVPETNLPIEETDPAPDEEEEQQLILTASETTVSVSSAILFEVTADEEPVTGADIYVGGSKIGRYQHTFDEAGTHTVIARKAGYIGSDPLEITVNEKAAEVDIYILGQAASESRNHYQPLYWKNGEWHPFRHEAIGGMIFHALTMADGQLHVTGERIYSSSRATAFHWSGDVTDELSDSNGFASGKDIAVAGGDVYIGGVKNESSSVTTIGYWKNGDWHALAGGSVGNTDGGPITVKGDDIYFAGVVDGAPTYWKNDTAFPLQGGAAAVTSMAVAANGDIYVAGYSYDFPNAALYWKNGERIVLGEGGGKSHATDLFIDGDDLYVAGWEEMPLSTGGRTKPIARYWKNGVAVDLTDGTAHAGANAIHVVDGEPYVVGVEMINPNTATLWKQGETIRLSHEEYNGSAGDLYVVKK